MIKHTEINYFDLLKPDKHINRSGNQIIRAFKTHEGFTIHKIENFIPIQIKLTINANNSAKGMYIVGRHNDSYRYTTFFGIDGKEISRKLYNSLNKVKTTVPYLVKHKIPESWIKTTEINIIKDNKYLNFFYILDTKTQKEKLLLLIKEAAGLKPHYKKLYNPNTIPEKYYKYFQFLKNYSFRQDTPKGKNTIITNFNDKML